MQLIRTLFLMAGLLAAYLPAHAEVVGQITHLSGTLSVKRMNSAKLLAVKSEVHEGDTLVTEAESYARIKFKDKAEVVLRPSTQLTLNAYSFDATLPEKDNIMLSLAKGGLRAVTGLLGARNKEKVAFHTPTATIGIRGTHFGALFCQGDCLSITTGAGSVPEDGLHVDVTTGAIVLSNSAGQQQINAGQFGYVPGYNIQPQIVPPQQGIQIALPPSIAKNNGAGRGVGKEGDPDCTL